ncbi:uncharacterized protein LOC143029769 [Oratosquilla oratoria]|uniref:uncharacterized protein LOC143029769 n=1 Tax=Oratosquilla oratoria TaxID=337810 RepID=UPI003F758075
MSEKKRIDTIPEDELAELNAAMVRVLQKDTELQRVLQDVDDLDQKKINLRAQEIYASKEIAMLAKKEAGKLEADLVSKMDFEGQMDQLHFARIVHGVLRKCIQTTIKNVQIQEALQESLQEMNLDKNVDSYPHLSESIKNTSENLEISTSTREKMHEKEELHQDILRLRLKYQELLEKVEDKWKYLHGQQSKVADGAAESGPMERLCTKLQARESKLQVMVFLLRAMLTSSGIQWGFNNHYIQVLLLCDEAMDLQQQNEQEVRNIITELEQTRGKDVNPLDQSPRKVKKTKILKLMNYSGKKK